MKCPFCDSLFPVSDFLQDQSSQSARPETGAEEISAFSEYHCSSCGANLIADETTAATSCPYCSNPVILSGRVSGADMPEYIIPFKLDKNAAKDALRKHLRGKKLLPKVFSTENHLDEVKGIYVPFWVFDTTAETQATYRGEKIRTWSDSEYNYTETSDFEVFRRGTIRFENVPADSARKMEDDLMESLETFDFADAVPFDPAYLSGYFADRYDVSTEECLERVRNRIEHSAERALSETVTGYGAVHSVSSSTNLRDVRRKYAMYPVWILNTTWRGRLYRFAMNGQTGKFVGNLPVDKMIYWKWRLLYAVGIGGAVYAAMAFLGFL